MQELQTCMAATSVFLENLAIKYFAKTGKSIRGFIVTESMRDDLAQDDECMFLAENEILIGADCWEFYVSSYPGIMLIGESGTVEVVK